jgi:AcrR family transcriptional regulator
MSSPSSPTSHRQTALLAAVAAGLQGKADRAAEAAESEAGGPERRDRAVGVPDRGTIRKYADNREHVLDTLQEELPPARRWPARQATTTVKMRPAGSAPANTIDAAVSPSPPAEKVRDAARSRESILEAAEELFAARGFDGASLHEIAAAAALSRGTPSYFFGSKQQLYVAVLERVFEARQAATEEAFRPIHAWCDGEGDIDALALALARATEGYMSFLLGRPAFVRLLTWEELDDAEHLRATSRASTAMEDAFSRLRSVAPRRGLRAFGVEDAILVYVSLTFAPVAHRSTFTFVKDRDLSDAAVRRRHVELVVAHMMQLLAGDRR